MNRTFFVAECVIARSVLRCESEFIVGGARRVRVFCNGWD